MSILKKKKKKNNKLKTKLKLNLGCGSKMIDGFIGIDKFGISAPGNLALKEYGFTVENIVKEIEEYLK